MLENKITTTTVCVFFSHYPVRWPIVQGFVFSIPWWFLASTASLVVTEPNVLSLLEYKIYVMFWCSILKCFYWVSLQHIESHVCMLWYLYCCKIKLLLLLLLLLLLPLLLTKCNLRGLWDVDFHEYYPLKCCNNSKLKADINFFFFAYTKIQSL